MTLGRLKLRTEHLVIVGGLALLMSAVLLLGPRLSGAGGDPQDLKRGSSHYTTPSGGKALYELLRGLGFDARRHARTLGLLPADARVVFLLAPARRLEPAEIRDAERWVESGGTLVWSPREAADADLPQAFGLSLSGGHPEAGAFALERGGRRYAFRSGTTLRLPGDAVVADVPRGRGRFVALADPRLASNRGLREADHAEFLVHLAARAAGPDGAILFDEYHHGFQEGQTAFSILMDSPLSGAVWILLAAAYTGVIAAGRRLGPPVDPRVGRRRRPREYLDAFAGVCAKLRAGAQAAGFVAAEFRQFLRTRFGAATPEAADRLAGRLGADRDGLSRTLADLSLLESSGRVGEAELVDVLRDVERARRDLIDHSHGRTPA